jgi:hypothetical protein
MAEAMLRGKPVVAIGRSGNNDFTDATNAALVPYRLVPARDNRLVYRGPWAEPMRPKPRFCYTSASLSGGGLLAALRNLG